MKTKLLSLCLPLLCFFFCSSVSAAEITAFFSQNQSPLIQIFGLPAPGNAVLAAPGQGSVTLSLDLASNYTLNGSSARGESLLLDGESTRTTIALRYGLSKGIELGVDLPLISHGGGFLDGFIEGWHDFFGLPQGGRKQAPRNRLLYSYQANGFERLGVDDSSFGIGDLRLYGAWQIYDDDSPNRTALALRTSLKLPTGNSTRLHGSGSTDIALWFSGSRNNLLEAWGHWTIFGALGGMAMGGGEVLSEQQNHIAGFGSVGIGWSPADLIAFKTQLSGHTPFYGGSALAELGDNSLQLLLGGTVAFSPRTFLDIGVSEDIVVGTSPDVVFHLALTRQF